MSYSIDDVIQAVGNMTIPELVSLTKELEGKWGVEAKPVVIAFNQAPETQKIMEEQTEFNVFLVSFLPEKKMSVVKSIRELLGLGLLESKNLVESTLPKMIKEGASKEDAETLRAKLAEAGATLEVK